MCDMYAVIKGKALTMSREFIKVYPNATVDSILTVIAREVIYAAHDTLGDNFSRQKTQDICLELKHLLVPGEE